MGVYDSDPRHDAAAYGTNSRPTWNPSSGGGDGAPELGDRFSGLSVSESSDNNNSIYQVIRAVEDAENTIKQQVSSDLCSMFENFEVLGIFLIVFRCSCKWHVIGFI